MSRPGHDDEDQVRRVLATYGDCYDGGRADAWADLFTEDGRFAVAGQVTEGRSAIRAYMERAQAEHGRGIHVTSDPVVDVEGDEATATSAYVYVRPGDGGPVTAAAGRYRDRLVRVGGRWRIRERAVSLLGVPEPGTDD